MWNINEAMRSQNCRRIASSAAGEHAHVRRKRFRLFATPYSLLARSTPATRLRACRSSIVREMPSRRMPTMSSICVPVMISGGDITHMLISGRTSRPSSWQCCVDALADVLVELQRIVAVAVGDAFDAGHQPGAAHLADQRQFLQRLQPRLEIGRDLARMVEDAAFQQVEVLQRHRAADRMAGIGVAMAEHRIGMVGAAQLLQHARRR